MKRKIPFFLTTLRLLLGPIALLAAVNGWPRFIFAIILATGTLSDIYDGVLARKFGVATPFLRRYDSVTDIIYYLFILLSTWLLCRTEVFPHRFAIILLLLSEVACIAVSFMRFGKMPATHTYLAKFYGLVLFACFLALLAFEARGWIIVATCAAGLVANGEIIAILLLSERPPVDVLSLFALFRQKSAQKNPHD